MNLENLGVQEMNAIETRKIDGGYEAADYACPNGNPVTGIGVAIYNLGVFCYNIFAD
jgi:hypothetical protein